MPKAKNTGGVGELEDVRKEKKPRLKYSGWHITVNLNKRFEKGSPDLKDMAKKFDKIVKEDLLEKLDSYIKLGKEEEWNDETVKNVDVDYGIELSPKTSALHTHTFIQLRHNLKTLHLDYQKIKEVVAEKMGLESVYFNSRLLKKSSDQLNVQEYVKKSLGQ